MVELRVSFSAEVWEHYGMASWHFVNLPDDDADRVRVMFGDRAGGFGSVRVEATIGNTRWRTSVFPDSKLGTYVLPLKKSVRAAENLSAGVTTDVELVIAG